MAGNGDLLKGNTIDSSGRKTPNQDGGAGHSNSRPHASTCRERHRSCPAAVESRQECASIKIPKRTHMREKQKEKKRNRNIGSRGTIFFVRDLPENPGCVPPPIFFILFRGRLLKGRLKVCSDWISTGRVCLRRIYRTTRVLPFPRRRLWHEQGSTPTKPRVRPRFFR